MVPGAARALRREPVIPTPRPVPEPSGPAARPRGAPPRARRLRRPRVESLAPQAASRSPTTSRSHAPDPADEDASGECPPSTRVPRAAASSGVPLAHRRGQDFLTSATQGNRRFVGFVLAVRTAPRGLGHRSRRQPVAALESPRGRAPLGCGAGHTDRLRATRAAGCRLRPKPTGGALTPCSRVRIPELVILLGTMVLLWGDARQHGCRRVLRHATRVARGARLLLPGRGRGTGTAEKGEPEARPAGFEPATGGSEVLCCSYLGLPEPPSHAGFGSATHLRPPPVVSPSSAR